MARTEGRRRVGDEEMRAAMADPRNKNIVGRVLALYRGRLGDADLETCRLHGLWRTLQYHDDSFGQKFTTNLHRFTNWECLRELRRQKAARRHVRPLSELGDIPVPPEDVVSDEDRDTMIHLRECIDSPEMLPFQKTIVNEHFFERRSLDEIGKRHGLGREAVRKRLDEALGRLREVAGFPSLAVYRPRD